MKSIYHPIGKVVMWRGIKLLVKEQKYSESCCRGCVFTNDNFPKLGMESRHSCCMHTMECIANRRKDNKHVIFVRYEI